MRSYDVTTFESPMELSERPTPEPVGEEVLIKILAAGVCHSDLHICDGYYDLGGGKKLRMGDRGVALPITMGHEIAGEVAALGPNAKGLKVGQRVVVYPWMGCGQCGACARGDENLCIKPGFLGIFRRGGYATHCISPHARYCLPIGDLDPVVAAPYACSGVTTYSALNKFDRATLRNEPIVVIGAGGLGLMCLSVMKALGAKGAIVVDIDPVKRAAALKAGALAAIDANAPDAVAQIQALTRDGIGAVGVVDLVGAGSSVQLAMASVARGGRIVVVGLIGGEVTIPVPTLPQRAMILQGSYVGNLQELTDLMAIVARGEIVNIPTQTRPLEGAQSALDDLRAGKVIGRIVLKPN
jgi:D-arabinose 1-dehydrogenase-like Zn-dependent alcohol dehydrogenase